MSHASPLGLLISCLGWAGVPGPCQCPALSFLPDLAHLALLAPGPSPGGCWVAYRCPYLTGTVTNIVVHMRGTSFKELDWCLLSAATPYIRCDKRLLPGLGTHLALLCDLDVPAAKFTPLDPSGRRFSFSNASPDQLLAAGAAASPFWWWAVAYGLPVDARIRLVWDGISFLIPAASRRLQLRPADAMDAAIELSIRQGLQPPQPRAWWQEQLNASFTSHMRQCSGQGRHDP